MAAAALIPAADAVVALIGGLMAGAVAGAMLFSKNPFKGHANVILVDRSRAVHILPASVDSKGILRTTFVRRKGLFGKAKEKIAFIASPSAAYYYRGRPLFFAHAESALTFPIEFAYSFNKMARALKIAPKDLARMLYSRKAQLEIAQDELEKIAAYRAGRMSTEELMAWLGAQDEAELQKKLAELDKREETLKKTVERLNALADLEGLLPKAAEMKVVEMKDGSANLMVGRYRFEIKPEDGIVAVYEGISLDDVRDILPTSASPSDIDAMLDAEFQAALLEKPASGEFAKFMMYVFTMIVAIIGLYIVLDFISSHKNLFGIVEMLKVLFALL